MPRCCYRHDAFKQEGYRHDGTDQCWITDVGCFQDEEDPGKCKRYCIFHAPNDQNPMDRDDWNKDERGEMQATQFHALLDEWNNENAQQKEHDESAKSFILPGLQCSLINFANYIFSDSVHFQSATFSGNANFLSATFSGNANFQSATFSGDANFLSATFSGNANFQSATFSGEAEFKWATFSNIAWFELATFSNAAWFQSATFSEAAGFQSATFSRAAGFASATFRGGAWFQSATFRGSALFQSATFSDKTSFESATFSDKALFESATFRDEALFVSVTFKKSCNFTNSGFHSSTNFSTSSFALAPIFHGAALHQGTDFRGAVFIDRSSREAPLAYRTLKLAMGSQHSRQEEARFYSLEQESRRHQTDTTIAVKISSLLYQWLSNYGQSFMRPLVWLSSFSGLLFWMVYIIAFGLAGKTRGHYSFVTDFTIRQIVRPFDVWTIKGLDHIRVYISAHGSAPLSESTELVIKLLGTVQSLSALVFVTLFLLAVRREFKLG